MVVVCRRFFGLGDPEASEGPARIQAGPRGYWERSRRGRRLREAAVGDRARVHPRLHRHRPCSAQPGPRAPHTVLLSTRRRVIPSGQRPLGEGYVPFLPPARRSGTRAAALLLDVLARARIRAHAHSHRSHAPGGGRAPWQPRPLRPPAQRCRRAWKQSCRRSSRPASRISQSICATSFRVTFAGPAGVAPSRVLAAFWAGRL